MMRGFVAQLAVLLIALSGCDAIVGAECADGFVRCGDRCVQPAECGSSADGGAIDGGGLDGAVADAGDAGVDPITDGSISDGALADAAPTEGGVPDGGAADAGSSDAGPPSGCDLGEIECAGVCVDARTDPSHCGGCGVACAAAEVCSAGVCTATCEPPLVSCGGRCIDVSSDADHCGSCGHRCESGICIDGECSGALAGHVIVVGHDYVASRPGMRRIAGNAVLLAGGSPARVIVFEGGSVPASRAGTDAAIQYVADDVGRSWDRLPVADPARVPLELADADAFVVYAQRAVDDATLRAWGAEWARALDSFVRRGGVVVLFDTTSTMNAGTWQILAEAGLFTATGRTETTGTITVVEPSDAVARFVPLTYASEQQTVRFETSERTAVCADGVGPVVVHRTLVP